MSNANVNVVVPFIRPRPAAAVTAELPTRRPRYDEPPTAHQAARLARTLRADILSVRFLPDKNTLELLLPRRARRAHSRVQQLLATAVAVGEFFADSVSIPVAEYSVGVESIDQPDQALWRLSIATHASMRLGIQTASRLIWQIGNTQRTFLLHKCFSS